MQLQSNSVNKVGVVIPTLSPKRVEKKYPIQFNNDTWYHYMIFISLCKHTARKHTQFRCIRCDRCNYNVKKENTCQTNDCITKYYFMVKEKKPHKCQYSSITKNTTSECQTMPSQ